MTWMGYSALTLTAFVAMTPHCFAMESNPGAFARDPTPLTWNGSVLQFATEEGDPLVIRFERQGATITKMEISLRGHDYDVPFRSALGFADNVDLENVTAYADLSDDGSPPSVGLYLPYYSDLDPARELHMVMVFITEMREHQVDRLF